MIELKPRCDGCGTGNALDAIFCQECGVGLNIENNNTEYPNPIIARGMYENETILWDKNGIKKISPPKCTHKTVVSNLRCECVRCIECDKRTETCFKHTPKYDYGMHTQRKNLLDHMREPPEVKTPFVVDKSLDFISNQIPDWEFKEQSIITQIEQAQTWPDKMVAKTKTIPFSPIIERDVRKGISETSGINRPFPIKHLGYNSKCNCDGIKTICDEFRAKQDQAPYSSIIGTDVRKGIVGFSSLEKNILKFSILSIIISLGILLFT